MWINGYNITGNHATSGRDYRVEDAAGVVLAGVKGPIRAAMALAEKMQLGDVPEPKPAPEPEPKAAPKPAKPKRARKAGK